MKLIARNSLNLLIFFALASCSQYQKTLNSDDFDAKLEMANKLYEKGQYAKAIPLYEELKRVFLGKDKMKTILFNLSYCEYNTQQFFLAAYHFKQFYESYPISKQAEEALFMHCKCQYTVSPKHSLDQESTQKAIAAFERFVTTFPDSEHVGECNKLIDELTLKIEEKAYLAAKLYYNIQDYKAAVWALNNFIKDYPGSTFQEEAEFLIVESSYRLAKNSVQKKQEERFVETIEYFNSFKSHFPKSRFMEKAKSYMSDSQKVLNEL